MNQSGFLTILLFICGFVLSPLLAMAGDSEPPADVLEDANNSYIFIFNSNVTKGSVNGLAKGLAEAHGGSVRHTFSTVFKGFSANMPGKAAAVLASKNPNIAAYYPNGVAGSPGNGKAVGKSKAQIVPDDITLVGGPVDVSSQNKHVWILDSGIDIVNKDLNIDLNEAINCIVRGKNTLEDGSGHGTHVAGIAAAIDNDIDAVGVAAGAIVHPIRVLNNADWGTFDEIICGIEYVANHADASRGDVANMSLYTTEEYPPLREAMRVASQDPQPGSCPDCKGIRFAVCAGNESDDLYDTAATYDPGELGDLPNIYTVSTVNNLKQFWSKSNYDTGPAYGMGKIAFTAPGVDIPSLKRGGGVWNWNGCSQATPHVAGILLLTDTPGQNGEALGDPDGFPDPFVYFYGP